MEQNKFTPLKTPPDFEEMVLFVWIYKKRIISEYVGTIDSAKAFRKYQLENEYTHWCKLPKI